MERKPVGRRREEARGPLPGQRTPPASEVLRAFALAGLACGLVNGYSAIANNPAIFLFLSGVAFWTALIFASLWLGWRGWFLPWDPAMGGLKNMFLLSSAAPLAALGALMAVAVETGIPPKAEMPAQPAPGPLSGVLFTLFPAGAISIVLFLALRLITRKWDAAILGLFLLCGMMSIEWGGDICLGSVCKALAWTDSHHLCAASAFVLAETLYGLLFGYGLVRAFPPPEASSAPPPIEPS